MLMSYRGIRPRIGKQVYISPTAVIEGDVEIGDGASIWHGAVLRGDMAPIRLGKNSNIQDNCTVHNDSGKPTIIGDHVTVGHNAVVHGCIVGDLVLIGIGAVVLTGAVIGKGCIIAAGAVVMENAEFPPYQLVTGIPARIKRNLTDDQMRNLGSSAQNYLELSAERMK